MADSATESLNAILEGVKDGSYVLIPDVPIFDAHDEFDYSGNQKTNANWGKLIRRFDKARLQAIADKCNGRQESTGDLAPFGPGHTIPNQYDAKGIMVRPAKEEDQPPIWGYLADYRVGPFGPERKTGLLINLYAKAEHAEKVKKEFPRRSIELYPKDNTIDWLAVLRRSPQRDLGLLAYSKSAHAAGVTRWCPWEQETRVYAVGQKAMAACYSADGKLRYSMENSIMSDEKIDDPTLQPNADVPADDSLSPEEARTAERFMKHYQNKHPMLQYMCKYGADGGMQMPSPTNMAPPAPMTPLPDAAAGAPPIGAPPGGPSDEKKDKERMSKESDAIRYSRLEAEVKQLRAERDTETQRYQRAQCERDVIQLEGEGYELDRADEVAELLSRTPEQRKTYIARLKKRYQRAPVGGDFIRVDEPEGPDERYGAAGGLEKHKKALQYMKDKGLAGDDAYHRALEAVSK